MASCIRSKIVWLALLMATPGWAAGSHFVEEVRIEGAVTVSEAAVREKLETRPGKITNREILNEDIRRLFAMGYFADIQVDERRGAHGWIYTFVLTEKAVITAVAFEGNKKIKDAALREKIDIPLYQPLNEPAIVKAMEAIREAYAKKRYYLAEIDHHLRTTPEGDQELVFVIHEHSPTLIRHLHFTGNAVFADDELRKVIKTRKKAAFSFITGSGKYNEEQLQQDLMRLTFHYLKHGFLKAKVEKPSVALSKDRRYFFVTFQIHEGPRYRIGSVDMAGDILTTRAELLSDLLTQPGQIYNREAIERDIQALTRKYADEGYAFVHIAPATTTNEIAKTADIVFQAEKGSRITVEKVEIRGNTVTRDKVIRRELKVKEGDLYSESRLEESRQKVMALGFFEEVNFATPRGTRDDALNLVITVKERPTGSFSLGVGFSTAEDFILTGSIQKQNFFGRGWSGELAAEVSSIRQQFLASMLDPYFLDSEWILGLSGSRTVFRFGDSTTGRFDRESFGGSVSIGRRFFDHGSMNLGYQIEDVEASSLSTFIPARFRENAGGLTSLLSLTLNRDTRDNRIYASKGMFNSVKFEVSGDKLGGDNDFYRITGRTQLYQPVIGKLNFKTFGRVGFIESLNTRVVPLFERFFLGGPNSLRGYHPQSIGPAETVTNDQGQQVNFVFGGTRMMLFNLELEHPIYGPAGLFFVTFFDAGDSYGEAERIDLTDLRLDWGFGLRWISPMGPLRFEWGFPIDRQANESATVFNFTIGTFF